MTGRPLPFAGKGGGGAGRGAASRNQQQCELCFACSACACLRAGLGGECLNLLDCIGLRAA